MIGSIGQYDRPLSRQFPGLFVILLDQSESMRQIELKSNKSKADIATHYVNTIIQQMIDLAQTEFDPKSGNHIRKNYAYLSVLGYNDTVTPLLGQVDPIDIPTLEGKYLGTYPNVREIRDRTGKVERTVTGYHPFWIQPMAERKTDMAKAFEETEKIVYKWIHSKPDFISDEMGYQNPHFDSFPPVVIHITDAKHNGPNDPFEVVKRIQQLKTNNGNVLVCNCHFTHEGNEPCNFPSSKQEVQLHCHSTLAERMFDMSSIIPDALREKAEYIMKSPIQSDARCFVFNANPQILIRFLKWSTLGNVIPGAQSKR